MPRESVLVSGNSQRTRIPAKTFGKSERRRAFEGEPVSYYFYERGGVPVKERIIFYTTRQREEVG